MTPLYHRGKYTVRRTSLFGSSMLTKKMRIDGRTSGMVVASSPRKAWPLGKLVRERSKCGRFFSLLMTTLFLTASFVASNDDGVSFPRCGGVASPPYPPHCVLPQSRPPHRILLNVAFPPSRPPHDHCALLTAPSTMSWCPTPTLILISILYAMPA